MATLYRAMWSDDRVDLVEDARRTVLDWVDAKSGGRLVELLEAGRTADGAMRLKVEHRADPAVGAGVASALRLSFVESRDDGVQWITRVRGWVCPGTGGGDAEGWLWVDVDAVTHDSLDGVTIAAPRFVRTLLAEGDRPRRGGVPLSGSPLPYTGEAGADELAELVTDLDRDLPVVVVSPLPADFHYAGLPPNTTVRERFEQVVDRAAAMVAGLAAVCVLDEAGVAAFASAVGADHAVRDGAFRVYLSGMDPAVDEPWRHRYTLPARFLQRRETAGAVITRAIALRASARRAPVSYEVAARFLDSVRVDAAGDAAALLEMSEEENDELRGRLATQDQRYQNLLEDHAHLEGEHNRLRIELATARRKLALVEQRLWAEHPDEVAAVVGAQWPDSADSPGEAAELARGLLGAHLCVPDGALVDLDRLDRAVESRAWGQTSWRAFLALYSYGEALAEEDDPGSFWTWCANSGHANAWTATPKKLAMVESDSVKRSDRLRNKRVFPVDAGVAAAGEVFMEMHIKIAEGGGVLAPRIYFVPSREQGKVHVGYFGPHKNVPNTLA
ncbi:hypothetical protein [Saccharothrix longispora]|uniref:hypothetical protein n=1 Tax=Saccharothrix longispora TaxID=33920 RepID=UPI0028FD8AE9|nr:hypothetical protein [Saccharothrix longispora]MDU0290964.1 hypothetical protein [Saccharothrix longispora]